MKKRALTLLVVISMLATLMFPTGVFAAYTSRDTLSDTVWTFSESTGFDNYASRTNDPDATLMYIDAAAGKDGTAGAVLDATSANCAANFYMSSFITNPIELGFDIKLSSSNVYTRLVFKEGSDYEPLAFLNGKVNVLGQDLMSFSTEKWYNVVFKYDVANAYVNIKLKAEGETAYKEFDVFGKNNNNFKSKTGTERIAIGGRGANGVIYIDNYYQNINNAIAPKLETYNDDFEDAPATYNNGRDLQTRPWTEDDNWYFWNGNLTTQTNWVMGGGRLNGNGVLQLGRPTTTGSGGEIPMQLGRGYDLVSLGSNVYQFKFKIGQSAVGNAATSSFAMTLGTAAPAAGQTVGNVKVKEYHLVTIKNGVVSLLDENTRNSDWQYADWDGTETVVSDFGALTPDTLYDCEAYYDVANKKLTAVITNAEGKQFSATRTIDSTSTLYPTTNRLLTTVVSGAPLVTYLDEFEINIITGDLVCTGPALLSGDAGAASLDETAIFTFNRTVDAASEAIVTLNGDVLDADEYTLAISGNTAKVTLKNLAKATDYTVAISGVCDMLGNEAEIATVSFTTASSTISATRPVLSGNTLTATATSYYNAGAEAVMIAGVYTSDGKTLLDSDYDVQTVSREGVATFTIDTTQFDLSDGKILKCFVWKGFSTMQPLGSAYEG